MLVPQIVFCAFILTLSISLSGASLPAHAVGRCVRVLGVTAPEDAKKVGFDYIELALQDLLPLNDKEFDEVVARIRAIGLPALSGYGFMPAKVKIVGPDADPASIESSLRTGLQRAEKLGLKMVVYGNLLSEARRYPEGFSKETAWKQLVAFGHSAANEAKKHGITILFEPMPARSTNTVNTIAEALELVKEVNDPNFQMLIDFTYVAQGKEDLSIVQRAAPYIKQVEIANPNGRVYPRVAEEADYTSFFQALKRGGYGGGFSIHGAPSDFFVDAPRAIALLRQLISQNF